MHAAPRDNISFRQQRGPDPSVPLDPRCVGFGEFLRGAREQRGVSLLQIASETKIPHRHLEALEQGKLEAVPGGTYRRGEVIAYANAVGLDRGLALTQLERALEASKPTVQAATPPRRGIAGIRVRRAPVLLLTIGAAVAAAGVWQARGVVPITTSSVAPQRDSLPSTHGGLTPTQPMPDSAAAGAAVSASSPRPSPEATSVPASTTAPTLAGDAAPTHPAGGRAADGNALVIVTDPPGARVTIDGIGWGATPLTVRHLPAGRKQIRVTLSGYAAEVRTLAVGEQGTRRVTIPLRPK